MGGMVAPALAILHPEIVRRAVFAGTCPPGNPRLATATDSWSQVGLKPSYDFDDIVALFYTQSEASQTAAAACEKRIAAQTEPVAEVGPNASKAQVGAMMGSYRDGEGLLARLGKITSPVLIAGGDHDLSFPALNPVVLLQSLKSATLALYPDAGHGFHMQDTKEFVAAIGAFLA